jgi:hypothetical protein
MTNQKLKGLFITFILAVLYTINLASANVIDDILYPFRDINFINIYRSYGGIIDFLIYAVFFVGLSQISLGKRFQTRGGRAVVTAVGLSLAIGLAITSHQLGFNLQSFGPLAAGIFIFLVGLILYQGIKTAGMNTVAAASIAIVVTYFSISAVAPNYFHWMKNNPYTAWIHSVVLIAVIISIYKLIRVFIPSKDKFLTKDTTQFETESKIGDQTPGDQIQQQKKEQQFQQKQLKKPGEEAQKTSKDTLTDLKEIRKLILKYGNTDEGRQMIIAKLQVAANKETLINNNLNSLIQNLEKLKKFDYRHFQQLNRTYPNLPPNVKKEIEAEIQTEWKKLDAGKNISLLENAAETIIKQFNQTIQNSISFLKANRLQESLKSINNAIGLEDRLNKILRDIRQWEKKLENFTKREIKIEKQEQKKAA